MSAHKTHEPPSIETREDMQQFLAGILDVFDVYFGAFVKAGIIDRSFIIERLNALAEELSAHGFPEIRTSVYLEIADRLMSEKERMASSLHIIEGGKDESPCP